MKKILLNLLRKTLENLLIEILHAYKLKLLEKMTDKVALQVCINMIDEKEVVDSILQKL